MRAIVASSTITSVASRSPWPRSSSRACSTSASSGARGYRPVSSIASTGTAHLSAGPADRRAPGPFGGVAAGLPQAADLLGARVAHAAVQHGREHALEGVGDDLQVGEVQVAVGELAVLLPLLDDPVDEAADRRGAGVLEGACRGLDRVGEHQHGRLLAARARAGVAEVQLLDLAALLERALVEVAEDRGAVVLRDERLELARQPVLARQLDPVAHVAGDDQVAEVGAEVVVRVLAAELVLDEELRPLDLADVVEQGADARQQRVAADVLHGLLDEVRDDQAVLVGARRLGDQELQERVRGAGELEQPEVGEEAEHAL